jgi:serine/threonine protein kinase
MNAERHQRIKEVFLAACDLPSPQVAEFIDQQCAGDAELRGEVESLLRHHNSETILHRSAADATPATVALPRSSGAGSTELPASPQSERFPPGTILAGRYRISAPLGRGGMGDVYRADDLKLEQPVALKFLARGRADDPTWLRRYRNEVRLARRVTHPNVLRVNDIVEADGEVFISMEYVDGEDLASLLRRVGRLTGDKVIQVAKQLCAGLGAAHDQGVLHRDLKPANVMIDGRGQVRIADFGIAALASQVEPKGPLIGTPAFMAPELFQGDAPSVRSDLFALGAVLYEMTTGKEPFESFLPGLHAREITPTHPSVIVPETDAALDRVILQCLRRDPDERPDSAYAVAAALPGGDPLAQALAAGETPSPSMVAAAGQSRPCSPVLAVACLVVALAALFLVMQLADRSFFLPNAGLTKAPAVLADRAEHALATLGQAVGNAEHWQGFALDRGYLRYVAATEVSHRRWDELARGRPSAVCFWYRVGPEEIISPGLLGESSLAGLSPGATDGITVRLDGQGRLLQFMARQDQTGSLETTAKPADWSAAFKLADLPLTEFRPVKAVRSPPLYADSLMAWEGTVAENPTVPIRVEGASLAGQVVYFAVTPPWRQDWSDVAEGPSPLLRRTPAARSLLYLLALVGGGGLALHNLRRGRGDQRGATKLLAFVVLLGLLDWLLGEKHVAVLTEELALFYFWLARAVLTGVVAWMSYFAVEPYVRRYWPQIMIGWSRVLRGKFRDPLVGRDLLVGGMCGIVLALLMELDVLLPAWLGAPAPLPKLPGALQDLSAVLGLRYKLNIVVSTLMTSITLTLAVLLLMLVLRVLLRRAWLATAVCWLALTVLLAAAGGHDGAYPWLTGSLLAAVVLALLVQAGLLALMVGLFVCWFIINSPMTWNLAAWYAPSSTLTALFVAGLVVYGFVTAWARPLISWQRFVDA